MLTFNIFFFVLIFTGYFFSKRPNVLSSIFGLASAAVICFIRGFFIIHHPIEGLTAIKATFRFFVPMIIIPLVIYLLYFLFNKDDSKSKKENFLSVILPVFILIMPFETVRNFPVKSFYVCFIRPLVYFAFLFTIDFVIQENFSSGKKVLIKIAAAFYILLNCFLVSFFDAQWFSAASSPIIITAELFYTAVLTGLIFLKTFKLKNTDNIE